MKHILVYGDLMIDRTWIVSGRVDGTSQAHGDVPPVRRIDPRRASDRLGGAGFAASCLAHHCATHATVSILCSSGEIEHTVRAGLTFHPLSQRGKPTTTVKFRVYKLDVQGHPRLRWRFDQDAPRPELLTTLPALPAVDLVVISDFKKGAVQPAIVNALLQQFPEATWYVDSKNERLFSECPQLKRRGGTLFLNRSEAKRLLRRFDDSREASLLDVSLGLPHSLSDLLDLGRRMRQRLPKWVLVIKLDREGAIAFEGDSYALATTRAVSGTGIGSGDTFLAAWIQTKLLTGASDIALKHATDVAAAWTELADSRDGWAEAWRAGREASSCVQLPVSKPPSTSAGITRGNTAEQQKLVEAASMYPQCLSNDGGQLILDLRRAAFGLGETRILSPQRRRSVLHFANGVKKYLSRPGKTRPLNCLLAARPGTGKSFIVRQVAESLGVPFYELNVSHFANADAFVGELARVASRRDPKCVVMLDEVDTELAGKQKVYPLLLGPLWDREVFYNGEKFPFGSHLVSVLVASAADKLDGFVAILKSKNTPKGSDLLSRLHGPRLQLVAPDASKGEADYLVLIASTLRKYHPEVRWITQGFVDVLYHRNLSPRELEYTLLELETQDDGYVGYEDIEPYLADEEERAMAKRNDKSIQIIDVS